MIKIKNIFRYSLLLMMVCLLTFNLCACTKDNEEDHYDYASEVVLSYNKSLTSTTLSKYMSSSRPVYFGISIEFNNNTKNSKTYNTNDFYFVFKQKTTSGSEVENEYISYSYYTNKTSSSFTINTKETKKVALWSNNACYLNGTGHYSIPTKVSLYYAGNFIASFVPTYN